MRDDISPGDVDLFGSGEKCKDFYGRKKAENINSVFCWEFILWKNWEGVKSTNRFDDYCKFVMVTGGLKKNHFRKGVFYSLKDVTISARKNVYFVWKENLKGWELLGNWVSARKNFMNVTSSCYSNETTILTFSLIKRVVKLLRLLLNYMTWIEGECQGVAGSIPFALFKIIHPTHMRTQLANTIQETLLWAGVMPEPIKAGDKRWE